MDVSYKKLWIMLIEKGIKTTRKCLQPFMRTREIYG